VYSKRVKILVIFGLCCFAVCIIALAKMQLFSGSYYLEKIAELKQQRSLIKQLKTARGKILDRKGRILAVDRPQFTLCINYSLSRFFDPGPRQAMLQAAEKKPNPQQAAAKCRQQIDSALEAIENIITKCTHFGYNRSDIENRINKINDKLWDLRSFLAWRRNYLDPQILEKYDNDIKNIPYAVAIADFQKKVTDETRQIQIISAVKNIPELKKSYRLLTLETDDDIFTAQLEFMDVNGISIEAKAHRFYPYGSTASQTIGWVGPATERYKLDTGRRLLEYLPDELCGRTHIEYVCESILRGKRGELIYDIDRQLQSLTEVRFGCDVQLALDIELQAKIERLLENCDLNPNCQAPTSAVVIDVASGQILTLASKPAFDLNRIRNEYAAVKDDPNKPLINRAINKQFPPGSVVKPIILIAGLESGQITADEVIKCPARKAPKGWPSCWVYNRYRTGHDDKWQNNARNAIKGSCNIYFSRLADRIEPSILQRWLFDFGYGRKILPGPAAVTEADCDRNLRQLAGLISSTIVDQKQKISDFNALPSLDAGDRKWFGIGQGNLRVTPLQVANAMACIARGGLFKKPSLFANQVNDSQPLNISPQTLKIVRDGMEAVVNEYGGTAYREFSPANFSSQAVNVYGKTGSTEKPENAWFAGFAEDDKSRAVAIAVVVEGGRHGSSDAAPLAREIIQYCIEAGYIGKTEPQGVNG